MEEQERKTLVEFLAFPLSKVAKGVRSKLVELDVTVSGYCRSLLTFGRISPIRTYRKLMRDMDVLQAQTDEWFADYRRLTEGALNVIIKYGG